MTDFEDLGAIARQTLKAGMCPEHLIAYRRVFSEKNKDRYVDIIDQDKTIALMQLTMQRGVEAGIGAISALMNIVWFNKRPCLWGDAAWTKVVSHHEYGGFEEKEDGFHLMRKKADGKVCCIRKYTLEDAEKAGLMVLLHWRRYTDRMLMIRARSWAMRDLFPDALHGLSIAEEQRDVEDLQGYVPPAPDPDDPLDPFTKKALEERGMYGVSPAAAALDDIREGVSFLGNLKSSLEMPGIDGTCDNCGKTFKAKTARKKFCSESCKNQFHYNKQKENQDDE